MTHRIQVRFRRCSPGPTSNSSGQIRITWPNAMNDKGMGRIPAYMRRNETTFETALRSVNPHQPCAGWLVDVSSPRRHPRSDPATSLRDFGSLGMAFTRFELVRRPRVEKIIKAAARISNGKAPGPAGRLIRDLTLPTILKLTATAKSAREVYEHHLDWNAPSSTAGAGSS